MTPSLITLACHKYLTFSGNKESHQSAGKQASQEEAQGMKNVYRWDMVGVFHYVLRRQ